MLRCYLPSRDRFLQVIRVDSFRLLVDTKASLLLNSLEKGMPMVPNKKASALYLIEAMTIYVTKSDSLNCKLVFVIMIRKFLKIQTTHPKIYHIYK